MKSPPLLPSLPAASPGLPAGQQGLNPQVSMRMARQLVPDCLGRGSRQVHVGKKKKFGCLHAAGHARAPLAATSVHPAVVVPQSITVWMSGVLLDASFKPLSSGGAASKGHSAGAALSSRPISAQQGGHGWHTAVKHHSAPVLSCTSHLCAH